MPKLAAAPSVITPTTATSPLSCRRRATTQTADSADAEVTAPDDDAAVSTVGPTSLA